jgi:ubiquitin-protein ligase
VNYTNYSKFSKHAPGADILNREFEERRRSSMDKTTVVTSKNKFKNLLNVHNMQIDPTDGVYNQKYLKKNINE